MFKHSIRRRAIVLFAGFTLLIALIYSAASLVVAYITEDAVIDRLLEQEAAHLLQAYARDGHLPTPRLGVIRAYNPGRPPPPFLLERMSTTADRGEIFAGDQHYHYRTLVLADGEPLWLIADVSKLLVVSTLGGDLVTLFVLALALGIGLSVWAAWRIASHTTEPVLQLAGEVIERSRHHRLRSLGHNTSGNEIDYLQQITRRTLTQLNDLLSREQAFNRDLSHELRTPLTIIHNTLALGEARPLSESELDQLRLASRQIQVTVDALFALARAQASPPETFALLPLLEECLIHCGPALEAQGVDVHLQVADKKVSGNRHLAGLVMRNLIDNAIQHGSGHSLSITSRNGDIVFSNPCRSSPPVAPARPGSAREHSPGLGQGLFLVERIVQTMDWHYQIEASATEFRFMLTPNG